MTATTPRDLPATPAPAGIVIPESLRATLATFANESVASAAQGAQAMAPAHPRAIRVLVREKANVYGTQPAFSFVVGGTIGKQDAAKLKVLVSIFGRETPVEVGYEQVKKV